MISSKLIHTAKRLPSSFVKTETKVFVKVNLSYKTKTNQYNLAAASATRLKGTGSRVGACSFIKKLFFCPDMLYRLCEQYDHFR